MNRQRRHRLRDGYDQRIAVFLAGMLFALAMMTPQAQQLATALMSFSRALAGS